MPVANMRDLLAQAKTEARAVGAFSVSSIDGIMGAVEAAEETRTPIILQVAQVRLTHSPLHIIGPAMLAAAGRAGVPVGVHLDHGTTLDCIRQALDLGFTSVMYDGSSLPMEENIAQTLKVIGMARKTGAAIEAEIGSVGKNEDGSSKPTVCAKPEDAIDFARRTQVDALAVAIGNAHGVYVGAPNLRFDVLEKIRAVCDTALVLHGGTGISNEDFRRAIQCGMYKINIATAAFMDAYRAAQGAAGYFDMLQKMKDAEKSVVLRHIRVFGVCGEGGAGS